MLSPVIGSVNNKKGKIMKETDKTKSTVVVGTLLAGTVFILSVTFQHWPSNEIVSASVVDKEISKNMDNVEPELNSNEYEVGLQMIVVEENITEPIELLFTDAFKQAREAFGPGRTFVWEGNLYTTDRADDDELDSVQFVLDTTIQETTSADDIEVAP